VASDVLEAEATLLDETKLRGAIVDVTGAMPAVVMRRIVDQVLALIRAADGAVVELADDQALTYVCAAGSLADHVGTRLPRDGSLSGLAVQTGETLHCQDAMSDHRVDREACVRVGTVSMVCVPLRQGDVPVGVLKVSAAQPHAFDRDDVAVLTKLAKFITVAISAASDIAEITNELLADCATADLKHAVSVLGGSSSSRPDRVSEFVANVLQPGIVADMASRQRIEEILAHRDLQMVCQPIVDLDSGQLVAAEALARFPGPPHQPPDAWFAQAQQLGLGVRLQLLAAELAVSLLQDLPEEVCVCVNAGPEAILAPELPGVLKEAGAGRVVLELTEHLEVDDYPHLRHALAQLRDQGCRLAVDDTGAGFASMAHIVKLAPELIKLDREFTRGIDIDPVRRSVAGAFVTLANETGATVIAEGIETADELDTVRRLGIRHGQGYFIARPAPVASLIRRFSHAALCDRSPARYQNATSRPLQAALAEPGH
jgi:EAL domain-containing protein (putative c-di-GMP-specific phosphodiesterase class I)